MSENVMVQEKS